MVEREREREREINNYAECHVMSHEYKLIFAGIYCYHPNHGVDHNRMTPLVPVLPGLVHHAD